MAPGEGESVFPYHLTPGGPIILHIQSTPRRTQRPQTEVNGLLNFKTSGYKIGKLGRGGDQSSLTIFSKN